MKPLIPSHSLFTIFSLFIILFLFPASSSNHSPFPQPPGLLFEEKTRLGSSPPSCHNKCNQCHPCMAVQVPSMSSGHYQIGSTLTRPFSMGFLDASPHGNSYSNYKPLGWKCSCHNLLFNP